jgi:O-antigen/teichoic acid export membrane protein
VSKNRDTERVEGERERW